MSRRPCSKTPRLLLGFTAALWAASAASPAGATTVGPVTELATPLAGQRAPAISYDEERGVYVIV